MGLRLGKAPARIDDRTITLRSILKTLPPPPPYYMVDDGMPEKIPVSMLGNDSVGDCVIVAEDNHTLRFECVEQSKCIDLTVDDALNQYYKEQGWKPSRCSCLSMWNPKPDNGLVMLDALNYWRQSGLVVGGYTYKIHAYASALVESEIKQCIYYLYGAEIGIALPASAMDQFNAGLPWDVTDEEFKNILGGHALYVVGYDEVFLYVLTWGRVQRMTWAFYHKYMDEAYGVVTARNIDSSSNPIDEDALEKKLAEITG